MIHHLTFLLIAVIWLTHVSSFIFYLLFCILISFLDDSEQDRIVNMWPKLMSQNCVIRLYDIIVQCVTDMNSKKEALFNLFMSDRKSSTAVRNDIPLFHLEFASFYHPTSENFPGNISTHYN